MRRELDYERERLELEQYISDARRDGAQFKEEDVEAAKNALKVYYEQLEVEEDIVAAREEYNQLIEDGKTELELAVEQLERMQSNGFLPQMTNLFEVFDLGIDGSMDKLRVLDGILSQGLGVDTLTTAGPVRRGHRRRSRMR